MSTTFQAGADSFAYQGTQTNTLQVNRYSAVPQETTTTRMSRSVTRRTVQGYDEAAERYQLRRSAKGQGTTSDVIATSQMNDYSGGRQSQLIQEKYKNDNLVQTQSLTAQEVMTKYPRTTGTVTIRDNPIYVENQNMNMNVSRSGTQQVNRSYQQQINYEIEKQNNYEQDEYMNTAENYKEIKQTIFKQNVGLKYPEREPNQVDTEINETNYVSCNLI